MKKIYKLFIAIGIAAGVFGISALFSYLGKNHQTLGLILLAVFCVGIIYWVVDLIDKEDKK